MPTSIIYEPGMLTARVARRIFLASAVCALCSAAAGAISDPKAMDEAKDKQNEGIIWTGGPPTFACVAGALGGALTCIAIEMHNARRRHRRCQNNGVPYNELDEFVNSGMVWKIVASPPLAIVGTYPIMYWIPIPFEVELIMAVSFALGATGVPLINLGVPLVENFLFPAAGRAGAAFIAALIAALSFRITNVLAPDMDNSNPGTEPDHDPQPKPKPKPKPRPKPKPKPKKR